MLPVVTDGFGGDIRFQSGFVWIVRIRKSDLMSLEEVQKRGGGRPHFVHEIGSEIVGLLCSESHRHCCWNWTVNIHKDRIEKKVVNIVTWWHYNKQEQPISHTQKQCRVHLLNHHYQRQFQEKLYTLWLICL